MRNLILALALFCAGSGSMTLWATGRLRDLGMNLFSESIGLLVTVFVVETLLKRDAARRAIPKQVCAYTEIKRLAQRMILLHQMIYSGANEGRRARDQAALVTADSYELYMGKVLLDASAPVLPSQTWFRFFCGQCEDFRERAHQIIDRYSAELESDVFALIHRTHDSVWNPRELEIVVMEARKAGSTQFRTMSSLLQFPSEWFNTLNGIIVWLEKEQRRLSAVGAVRDEPVLAEMFHARD